MNIPIYIKLLILAVPYLFEVVRESIWFIKLHKYDNHVDTTWIRAGMMAICSLLVTMLSPWDNFWWYLATSAVATIAIHFTLFNYTLNLARIWLGNQRHIHFFYLGNTVIDNWLKQWCPYIGGGLTLICTFWLFKPSIKLSFKIGYVVCQLFVLGTAVSMVIEYWL